MKEFWRYITCSLMFDKRRNLFPDDLQWFWMKILTQKFALFEFLEVGGKKKWSCVVACWILNENSIYRDLTHAARVISHRSNLDTYFRNERNILGKEHNSMFWMVGHLILPVWKQNINECCLVPNSCPISHEGKVPLYVCTRPRGDRNRLYI